MKLSYILRARGWYSPVSHPDVMFRLDKVTLVHAFEVEPTLTHGAMPAILVNTNGLTHTMAFGTDRGMACDAKARDVEVYKLLEAIEADGGR